MAQQSAPANVTARDPASNEGAKPSVREPGKSQLERDLSRVDGSKWLRRLGVLLAILAVIGGVALWVASTKPKPPPRYVLGQTSKGDIFETVQSTGQVQPLTQVQVGAQV